MPEGISLVKMTVEMAAVLERRSAITDDGGIDPGIDNRFDR